MLYAVFYIDFGIITDGVDSREISGIMVGKGTIGAIMANCAILYSESANLKEKESTKEEIMSLVAALVAIELHKHVIFRNTEIQKTIDDYIKSRQ